MSRLDTFWFKQDGFLHVWTPRAGEAGWHEAAATGITLCRVALRPRFAGLEQEYIQRLLPGLASLLCGGMLHISEVAPTVYPRAFLQCALTHVPLRHAVCVPCPLIWATL